MVLKLYASNLSPPSRYVGVILHEKKVPFELVHIEFSKNEQKSPANLANQPFGQVPYIVVSVSIISNHRITPINIFVGGRWLCPLRKSSYRSLHRDQIRKSRNKAYSYRGHEATRSF